MATQPLENQWDRPDQQLISDAYNHLFNSSLTRERLKDHALRGSLCPEKFQVSEYVLVGRSLAWKAFLTPVPPLTSELSYNPIAPLNEIREARARYCEVCKNLLQAPDGSYEEGFTLPGQSRPPTPTPRTGAWERNNPLSLDEANPWKEWFANVELRKTIRQDVERTFPEIPYFRDPQVQSDLTTALFLHAAMHPGIGYRQGMHELLAAVFLAVDNDSLDRWTTVVSNETVVELCDRTWVAADSWSLFGYIMKAISSWYEWQEQPSTVIKDSAGRIQPYVAPIVLVCNKIQNQYLSQVDPALWEKLSEVGVEPQLYGIRWLRLLFTREFSLREAMTLWDGLFAVDTSLSLVPWICVAMLIRIRNKLIPSDFSQQLTYLLRYSSVNGDNIQIPLLLQQAARLRQNPTPSTGASIMIENRNSLGIPIEVPEPARSTRQRQRGSQSIPQSSTSSKRESQQIGIPEIARNLYDRSESLGINRAIFNTVTEIRRNLPEMPAAFTRPTSSSSVTSMPSLNSPEKERSVWDSMAPPEIEAEVKALKAQQKTLAGGMSWALDVLLQNSEDLDPRKKEALECLSYVRDVLSASIVTRLDDERLLGEEERSRRKKAAAERKAKRQAEKNLFRVQTDQSIGGVDPDPRVILSKRDSKPLTGLTRTPPVGVRQDASFTDPLSSTATVRASSFVDTSYYRPVNQQPELNSAPATISPHPMPSFNVTTRGPIPSWDNSPVAAHDGSAMASPTLRSASSSTRHTPSYSTSRLFSTPENSQILYTPTGGGYPPTILGHKKPEPSDTDPLGVLQ